MKKQITNNKKSSISLKKTEATSSSKNTTEAALISVLENIPTGILIYNITNILFANKAAYKILNHSPRSKKITDYSVFDFLLPEYHQLVKDNTKKLLKGESVSPKVIKIKNEKGKIFDLKVKSNVIYFADKKAIQTIFTDVTAEISSENLRKEIEEKFKYIVENANDLIYFYTYHPKPKYVYVSPSVKRILGYSPKDFYNNPFFGLSLITEKENYYKLEKEVARQQKNGTLKCNNAVFQYKTKSGKLIWLEDDYSPIYDENGKMKWILGISRDITNEKNYQLLLEQKGINYQNLLDNAPVGIFIHKGNCLYANQKAASILEIKNPKKLLGKYLIDFIVPEQRQIAVDRVQRALKGEDLKDFIEYKVKTQKGNFIYVELKTVPFVYNGEPCVQTIISDVTDRKQLEKETIRAEVAEDLNKKLIEEIKLRKRVQKELVIQTTKYEAIFNNTAHLVSTINKDFKITSFNQNYFDFIKTTFNHELKIGDHLKSIKTIPRQDFGYNIWQEKLNDIFEKQKTKTDYFEIKNYDLKNGPIFREIYLHPLKNSSGEIDEIAVIGHDVTQRKLAEEKNIEQSAKLSAIFDSGTQLIWTIGKNYELTSFNNNFSDAMFLLYGTYPERNSKQEYNPQKGTDQAHVHTWWKNKYDEVFNTHKGIEFTVEQIGPFNRKYFRQIFINPIFNNNEVNELACLSYDITELKYLQSESLIFEQKLASVFESTSHLIWTVNKNFEATTFNQAFSNVFEDKYKHKPYLNIKLSDILGEQDKIEYDNFWEPLYKRVLNGEKLQFERKDSDSKNNIIYRDIFINPIFNDKGEIVEVACLAHNITKNKTYEEKILNQSAKLNAIFESTSHLIWSVNKNFELTSYNSNYFKLVKDNLEEKKVDLAGKILIKHTIKNPERLNFWIEKYKLVLSGKQEVFVHKNIDKQGNEIYREVYLHPIYSGKEVVEVSVIANDITERIENEQQILKQSAKLKAIFESGTQLMWTITKDLKLTSFNQNYASAIHDLYDFYPQVGKSIRELSNNQTIPYEPLWNEKYDLAFKGFPVEFTSERTLLNGNKVYRQYYLYPIENNNNEVEEVSGIGFDITENKINESKIIQSLKEKEILLKEVHHRVKNNMQVISSILNLQSSYVKDTYALNLLKECQNRVKSMAFIHESLYQTKNFESVNFSEYVTTLTKNLIHTYSVNTQKIKLILTLDKLFLNLDTSIPCGLIINEIISNSLKYAFPNDRDGIIFVTLKVNRHKVMIEAGDNGVGIPDTIDIKETQTLGLQLVDTLIEQLGGTLELDRTKGTKFIIEFKI